MDIMDLNPNKLMIFYYVALEGGITNAAKKLCLTQPTITYHLKSLENYAGVKLFNIKYNKFYLTEAGRILFKYAQDAEIQLRNADKYLKMLNPTDIRIGVTPLFYNTAASALARLWKSHPETNFVINSIMSPLAVQQVSDLEINVGVVMVSPYHNSQVKPIRVSSKQKLVFIASPDIPIAKKAKVAWKDLENYLLLVGPKGSLTQKFIIDKFNSAKISSKPRFAAEEINIRDSIKIFIESGNGIAIWTIKDIEAEVESGKIKVLPVPEEMMVSVDVIVHKNIEILPPVIKEFIACLKHEFEEPGS
jgi:DNA-binding transcriptional LysR family regulator